MQVRGMRSATLLQHLRQVPVPNAYEHDLVWYSFYGQYNQTIILETVG